MPVTAEYRQEAITFQGERARRYRNRARFAMTCAIGFFTLDLVLGYALICTVPLIRAIPVFITLNSDGSFDTKVMFSSLPNGKRVAAIEATLWQYVRERESYSFHERPYDYDVVSAMSAPAVRTAYQTWANSKDPSNPAVKLMDKGYINVRLIDAGFTQHADDYSSGTYRVVFERKIVEESVKDPLTQRMIVSVTYALADSVPVTERITFNPVGLIVTEYPELSPDGPAHRLGEGT